jgi:hypothetical protein
MRDYEYKQAHNLCIAGYIKLWHAVFKQRPTRILRTKRGQKGAKGVKRGQKGPKGANRAKRREMGKTWAKNDHQRQKDRPIPMGLISHCANLPQGQFHIVPSLMGPVYNWANLPCCQKPMRQKFHGANLPYIKALINALQIILN